MPQAKRIAVAYTPAQAGARPEDADGEIQRDEVSSALLELGHEPLPVPFTLDLLAVKNRLTRLSPCTVFNLVEAVDGSDRLIHLAPSLFESMKLRYTGSPSEAFALTNDKLVSKRLMAAAGIATPAWIQTEGGGGGLRPGARAIIKPVCEHGSSRVDEGAVVDGADAIEALSRAEAVGDRWFAEEFIEGREFNISIIERAGGPEALPHAEIEFVDYPDDKPRIVGRRAKWEPESFEFTHTPRRFGFAAEDAALLGRLTDASLACWRLFGLHGYARVDFRVGADGVPQCLEVNSNPCLSRDAGFAAAAARGGLRYADTIAAILESAEA